MSPIEVGILGCLFLLLLLVASLPVAFAMAVVGFFGFAILVSMKASMSMVSAELYDVFSSYSLTVIPLFVFMGQIAFHSGISRRLFNAAYHWFGPLPGGLAMATIGACTAFGAICGSGPATAATMAAVALPEMRRYHYDMELATGAVAAGGSLGMLIPPSVVFIVYGIMTEQSVGKLFIAGIVPGLLIAGLFCGAIYINCRRRPHLGPAAPRMAWTARFGSLLGVIETLILFALVIGGMFAGFFTPTQAAGVGAAGSIVIALVRRRLPWRTFVRSIMETVRTSCMVMIIVAGVGAAGSIVIALVRRRLPWRTFVRSIMETVRTSCMVMIIVAGAVIFGRFLAVTQIPYELASYLAGLPVPGWAIVGLIILFYLLVGCFVDALALILLTIPIFSPVIEGLGYDLIWFGVIIVIVTQMGVISPPVGVCVYVVSGIERDVPLQTVFRGALPFLLALIVAAAILIALPQLCLFLPELVN